MKRSLRKLTVLSALCCLGVLAPTSVARAADSIFWSNYGSSGGSISRALLAGGGGADLAQAAGTVASPYGGTVIDPATGKIYWSNYDGSSIGYSNLDGSEAGLLNTTGATIETPSGLAIDPAAGRIYWVDNAGGISYANLDGSGGGNLNTTGGTFSRPFGLAIYPATGRIYWANYQSSTIGYANLDGSGAGQLPITGVAPDGPDGIAVDAASGKLYWANYDGPSIGYANLDGSGGAILDTAGASIEEPVGVAIDPDRQLIYWTNENDAPIGFAALDGSGGGSLDTTGASLETSNFPALLEVPKKSAAPKITGGTSIGSTLTCTPASWAADLVESFLFRAPRTTATSWTLNGAPIEGATGATLTVTQPGEYVCRSTATNGAGSTTSSSAPLTIATPSPTPAPPATSSPPPATGVVTTIDVTRVKLDRQNGTATILAKVSGPGTLTLTGKKVVGRSVKTSGAGIARLKVASRGGARRTLIKAHKVTVRATVTFAATGGSRSAVTQKITLRRGPPAHRSS